MQQLPSRKRRDAPTPGGMPRQQESPTAPRDSGHRRTRAGRPGILAAARRPPDEPGEAAKDGLRCKVLLVPEAGFTTTGLPAVTGQRLQIWCYFRVGHRDGAGVAPPDGCSLPWAARWLTAACCTCTCCCCAAVASLAVSFFCFSQGRWCRCCPCYRATFHGCSCRSYPQSELHWARQLQGDMTKMITAAK